MPFLICHFEERMAKKAAILKRLFTFVHQIRYDVFRLFILIINQLFPTFDWQIFTKFTRFF